MFRKAANLSLADMKNIYRDPLLIMSFSGPILLSLVIKYLIPVVFIVVEREFDFNLFIYKDILNIFMIAFIPMMLGILAGFLILDERDSDILSYISITPLSKQGYLCYRLLSPVLICFSLSLLIVNFLNVNIVMTKIIILSMVSSIGAPLMALYLGTFASNKVEGIALSKAMGIMSIAPIVPFFIKSNWQYIAGILPTFWVSKAFLSSGTVDFFIYITIGLLIHLAYIYLLLNKFNRKIE